MTLSKNIWYNFLQKTKYYIKLLDLQNVMLSWIFVRKSGTEEIVKFYGTKWDDVEYYLTIGYYTNNQNDN